MRNHERFAESLASLASPDLSAHSFSFSWILATFTWRTAFVFIRSLAVQGLNVVQHDTTPYSTASRTFLAYLPTFFRLTSGVFLSSLPFSGPSSTPHLNCPGARLGKNSLAIRFIFSRHGDSSLSLRCTKNRAVVVSRLTLHFFFFLHARLSLAAYGLIACDKCKSVCAWDGGGFTRLSRRIFANTER